MSRQSSPPLPTPTACGRESIRDVRESPTASTMCPIPDRISVAADHQPAALSQRHGTPSIPLWNFPPDALADDADRSNVLTLIASLCPSSSLPTCIRSPALRALHHAVPQRLRPAFSPMAGPDRFHACHKSLSTAEPLWFSHLSAPMVQNQDCGDRNTLHYSEDRCGTTIRDRGALDRANVIEIRS